MQASLRQDQLDVDFRRFDVSPVQSCSTDYQPTTWSAAWHAFSPANDLSLFVFNVADETYAAWATSAGGQNDRIAALWPLYGADEPTSTDIRKFEQIGTRAGAPLAAIGQALDFHEAVGPSRKAARLRYLGSYVIEQLRDAPGIQCFTDGDERRRGSLMRILVKDLSGEVVEKQLRDKYGIWTFGRLGSEWDGIYISPNLFNLPAQLDRFAKAMREIAAGAGGA